MGLTMPLTPADVHNVAFSKSPIGKRGYNEDEVDAFLDLVENELTRLIEENSDLRQRIEELDRAMAGGGGGAGGGARAPRRPTPHRRSPFSRPSRSRSSRSCRRWCQRRLPRAPPRNRPSRPPG